jgi:hypothetical protein
MYRITPQTLSLFAMALAVCVALSLVVPGPPARAGNPPLLAEISIQNTTHNTFQGITGSLDGGATSNGSHWAGAPDTTNPDGSPAAILGPGQTMIVQSESNSGVWPSGTGGSITIPGAGTLTWSVPWAWFNGGLGEGCSSNTTAQASSGNTFGTPAGGTLTGGATGAGQAGCAFSFGITPVSTAAKATSSLHANEALSRGAAENNSITGTGPNGVSYTLTLGDDGNLVASQHTPLAAGQFTDRVVWATNTNNGDVALMQDDGNFVLLDTGGHTVWASNTAGHPGAFVVPAGSGPGSDTLVPAVVAPNPLWWGQSCNGVCGNPPHNPPTGCSFSSATAPVSTLYGATCDANQPGDVAALAIADLTFGGMSPWDNRTAIGWQTMNASGQPTLWISLPTTNNPGLNGFPDVSLTVCSVNQDGTACDSSPYSFTYLGYNQGGGVPPDCDEVSVVCEPRRNPHLVIPDQPPQRAAP